jgi:hypothetical protein
MMEPGPVLERCRSGGVIRWARIGLQLGQFHPLKPKPMEVLDVLLRFTVVQWKKEFGHVKTFDASVRSIVPMSQVSRRLDLMGYTEADLDASNPYTQWAREL